MSIFKIAASSSGNVRSAVTRYLELKYPKTQEVMYQYIHSAIPENAKNAADIIKKKLNGCVDKDIVENRIKELRQTAVRASKK